MAWVTGVPLQKASVASTVTVAIEAGPGTLGITTVKVVLPEGIAVQVVRPLTV